MTRVGVTVGKFYPFHLGHFHLIETMSQECDLVYVILATRPEEKISSDDRWSCIYSELDNFSKANVMLLQTIDDIPDDSKLWAEKTWDIIGELYPMECEPEDRYEVVVYTSEAYGEPWAEAMGVKHRFVGRDKVPISGTEIRAAPYQHFDKLPQSTKNLLTFKVAVVGPESSGKTTLCKSLAAYYDTVWVPEYGRYYTEGMPLPLNLDDTDLIRIGTQQALQNKFLTRKASNGIIVYDTDKLQTSVWAERYLGYIPEPLSLENITKPDLYILCKPDFEWVQDSTRESQEFQWQMYYSLYEKIRDLQAVVCRVGDSPINRLNTAQSFINIAKEMKDYK